jgi:glutaredoxin
MADSESSTHLDFYWRPGCGFCSSLRRKLDQLGIERQDHNIWEDADAAEVVRSYANGSETVPTVVVGSTGLVNPRVAHVLALLSEEAPHLIPEGAEIPEPGPFGRFVGRLLGA